MSENTENVDEVSIAPVTPEDLETLSNFEVQRLMHAQQLLDIEMQKITLLASARKSEQDRQAYYNNLLASRGLDTNTAYTIDSSTGVIQLEE